MELAICKRVFLSHVLRFPPNWELLALVWLESYLTWLGLPNAFHNGVLPGGTIQMFYNTNNNK